MTAPFTTAVSTDSNPIGAAERTGNVQESDSPKTELILMDRLVELLIQKAKARIHWPDVYSRAASTLRGLGLPTRQGLLVAKRLRNAERYASELDFGAATFELRLVRTQLA